MARTHAPVSSFGPELQSVLREGANREVKIKFETGKQAVRFVARINALRSAMRKEKHPDADQLYRAGARIDPTDLRTVIVSPRDSEFRSFISDAKVGITSAPPTAFPEGGVPETSTPVPGVASDVADSFLSTLSEVSPDPQVTSKKDVDLGDK